ncbi:MAG: DNA mismatch repair endonuclease MutL [Pseudomonadota bacterium]
MDTISPPRTAVKRLDDRLVDKIAAGEVVERPASVAKELIENALDAGATTLTITAEGAGIALLRVADDGAGIAADELELAVSRHCTSKVAALADLDAIATMGFRGEALPSIGAVSRLTVASAQEGAAGATISVVGGRVSPVAPAGRARGTTVSVEDLFFATPARRKFLKAERTEAAALGDTIKRLALAAPHVAFTYTHGGRTQRFPAGGPLDRARAVMGEAFAAEAIPLAAEREGVRLSGLLGLPTDGRATGAYQYTFVNGRLVRDKLITQALRAGYIDVMAGGRHPAAVLFVAVPPETVDVNVHPQKADVRFSQAAGVRGAIVSAIRGALAEAAPRTSATVSGAAIAALRPPDRSFSEADAAEASRPTGFQERRAAFSGPARPRLSAPMPPEARPSAPVNTDHPLGAAVGQVADTYILAKTEDGMVIVDQHAAHERIVYEALKASAGAPKSQGLLIPDVVEVSAEDADRLEGAAEAFAALGLLVERFGPGAVVVRETPAALGTFDVAGLIRALAADLAEGEGTERLGARLDHVAATMACHGSVRAGRRMAAEEMNTLLRQIETTPAASQCNHGRPTFVRLTKAEIERLFHRR